MMSEAPVEIIGFAIVPPATDWPEEQRERLDRLLICYGRHIPLRGLITRRKAIVGFETYTEDQRWKCAFELSNRLYPNATPQMVYEKGLEDMLLVNTECLVIRTDFPLTDAQIKAHYFLP